MAKKKATKKAPAEVGAVKAPSKLNKEEALAELAALGKVVEFDKAYTDADSVDTLRKAVAAGRKAVAEADAANVVGGEKGEDAPADTKEKPAAPAAAAPAAPATKEKSLDIVSKKGDVVHYVRTFCEDVHGEGFAQLAADYVAKHGGEVVPSSTVKAVRVRWEEVEKNEQGVILNDGRMVTKYEPFRGSDHDTKSDARDLAARKNGIILVADEKKLK